MLNNTFFDRLFEGEINWAFHTTMTCDLLYSMQLAYKLVGKNIYKEILSSDEKNKTAVFYNKDTKKGRGLSFKGAGRKKKVKDYLCINHPVYSADHQTFHAKISLISYKNKNDENNQECFRLAVYSKNCEFNDKCAETAIILKLEQTEKETKSGKNLVNYIKYLKDHIVDDNALNDSAKKEEKEDKGENDHIVDQTGNTGYAEGENGSKYDGKKWIENNIEKIYGQLEKCKFSTEFDKNKEVDLFFGGIKKDTTVSTQYTVLNEDLHMENATDESVVLTPPEFVRGTTAQEYFENNKILYDLNAKGNKLYSSSHIKLYLLKKKSSETNEDIPSVDYSYELWIGSANATVHGIGWSFSSHNSFGGKQSVECLVRIPIKETEFKAFKAQIGNKGYEIFEDFNKEGSLKKSPQDDFGPWICENMEVVSIIYKDSNGNDIRSNHRGNAKKICVKLTYKKNVKLCIPGFKAKMCWRPAEYADMQDCVVYSGSLDIEYDIKGFRPSQGVLCFGTSQSIMVIGENIIKGIPQVEEKQERDTRVSELLLSKDMMLEADDLDDTPNEGINWFYDVVRSDREKKLPCITCTERELETKPMEFQEKAAVRLKQILDKYDRAFLADEPGLGKTYSATKLLCDMAAHSKRQEPFYVIYVAPNQSLLEKNGKEIISKAKEGLLKDGWEIHMLSEYISKKDALIRAYKRYIEELKRLKEEVCNKEIEQLNSIKKIQDCSKNDNTIRFEEIARRIGENEKIDSRVLIEKYQKYDCPWDNYHKIFYAAKIGDNTGSSKNRRIVAEAYVKAYKSIKKEKILKQKEQDFVALEKIMEGLRKKEPTEFETYPNRVKIYKKIDELCIQSKIVKFERCTINRYYEEDVFPDRLAYAYRIIENTSISAKNIILITVSQGCLFGDDARTDLEEKIIKNTLQNETINRNSFTEWFLEKYKPGLIIWDEYHRYLNKLKNGIPFLKPGIKNLFVSATPYKTNISGKDNKELIDKLFDSAKRLIDDPDDAEADDFSNLPSFDDFAILFCENTKCLIDDKFSCGDDSMQIDCLMQAYKGFCEESSKNKKMFENLMKEKMVRHERSRLQGEHERHIRKYPAIENVGEEYRIPFLNTLRQSHSLEIAGYPEGARKWSLSLPWILDFSTKDRKAKKENGDSNYFSNLKPKKNLSDELFVYNNDGTVKNSIHSLPVQNLVFFQICKENAYDRMRQLLWIPPTVPLYHAGNSSIFNVYSSYSKLLVFAEYRYLQRGGSRLLSDFIRYENIISDKPVPQGFTIKLGWSKKIAEIKDFNLLGNDYREKDLDELIILIKQESQFKEWDNKKILAAIASPAICAYRLGLDSYEVEEAFNDYFNGDGKKEALWNWICENGYENKCEEGILRYCAEGNLYAMLEEWLFVLKKDEEKKPTDQICEILRYEGSKVYVQTGETSLEQKDGMEGWCSFAEQLTGDVGDNGSGQNADLTLNTANAFRSPLWPMVMFAGRGAQEGIDFHEYCLRIMHLTLPRGAVSYEQRNGRIDRFRSLLIRRRVAEFYMGYGIEQGQDYAGLMKKMFAKAILMKEDLKQDKNEIFPNWHFHVGKSIWNFEELIPMWNYTDESSLMIAYDEMLKSYRGSLGMNSTMEGEEGIDLSAK